MIKTIALVLFVLTLYCIAQQPVCDPANAPSSPSTSCSTEISGPNLASPAKRQSVVCSGNGQCNGDTCVCNAGFQGNDCETACTVPTTAAPSTAPPTAAPTDAPTVPPTLAPTTAAPSSAAPSSAAPSSAAPSTAAPSTAAPTTAAPSTAAPSTAAPSSAAPSSAAPSTAAPSTAAPTTAAPSTAAPTTQPPVQNTPAPTHNCWTCPAGFVHWYDVSGMVQPEDACACVPSSTPAPTSATCANVDISGPNNASPARRFWNKLIRQASACNGNGYCSGQSCVCNLGYTGSDCQTRTPSTSCQADISGPNLASPAKRQAATVCSGNGSCNGDYCDCNAGFAGADCEVDIRNGTPTPAATENTSGENNAKAADSSATKVTSGALIITAAAVLLL